MTYLLSEDGSRWMEPDEQFRSFPSIRELQPYHARPVWLVLSIALRSLGYRFNNGLGIKGQMEEIRWSIANHG